ncbi:hypothetical protein BNJ_00291 [Kaumoebavirus]|uniref:hypothetical protein n=1 Tax=Kaumoebavirus TaxID=1859492 RepID=UPI0009C1CB40|nr:hypothetical protein BNJ_00291 [Kaumoebavirus]ARA72114.1 hypothetical protein BNJ_00291 [Kaumoebavirus]
MYLIHDNGGRPFAAKVDSKKRVVQVWKYNSRTEECGDLVYETKYKKVFVGDDTKHPEGRGNSILVHIAGTRYVFIGWMIEEFDAGSKIAHYYSPIGNSDVPYPYAVGPEGVWLMIERVFIPNALLWGDLKNVDPYHLYYAVQKAHKGNVFGKKYKSKVKVKRA